MIVDKAKLKAAAEAATQGVWTLHERRIGAVVYAGPIQHWANGSGQSQVAMMTGADWMRPGEPEANAAFVVEARPEIVLALLAENEALRKDRDGLLEAGADLL